MKRIITLVLLFSFTATAAEVTKFDPRPAVVEHPSGTYVGILLSEEDFRKMLQKKIDATAEFSECLVDKKVCTQMQETYKSSIAKLEEHLSMNNSWFERNRGAVGLFTGLVVGVGTSIAIVRAVYQGQ